MAAANKWTDDFDARLADDVEAFKSNHPGVTVVSPNLAGLYQTFDNPFGIVNWTDAVGKLIPGTFFLDNPTPEDFQKAQTYFFFDSVHPTTNGHQLAGLQAAAAVYDALGIHDLVVTSTAD